MFCDGKEWGVCDWRGVGGGSVTGGGRVFCDCRDPGGHWGPGGSFAFITIVRHAFQQKFPEMVALTVCYT